MEKYDPLAKTVRPHIALVLPFESGMSDGNITEILADQLKGALPFALTLQGIAKLEDRFGHYLFLQVK